MLKDWDWTKYWAVVLSLCFLGSANAIADDLDPQVKQKIDSLVCLKNSATQLAHFLRTPTVKPFPDNVRTRNLIDKLSFLDQAERDCLQSQTPENAIALQKIHLRAPINTSAPAIFNKHEQNQTMGVSEMDCSQEDFNELGQDTNNHQLQTASTLSALLSEKDFPLKNHLTCVRDQANRGTCVSFATVAAVETLTSERLGRKQNFSEQSFYETAKRVWEYWSIYGDGLVPTNTYKFAKDSTYDFMPGDLWQYNPSWSRIDDGWAYYHSCDNYPSAPLPHPWSFTYCSDTNHQGPLNFLLGDKDLDITMPTSAEYSALPQWANSAQMNIHGVQNTVSWFDDSLMFLREGTPLTLAFWATYGFIQPGPHSTVNFDTNDIAIGGHMVEIVGYVPNAKLPADYPLGGGGGYYIVKNSWGVTWGDQGYVLLSVEYVQNYGSGLWAPDVIWPKLGGLDSLVKVVPFPNPAVNEISFQVPTALGDQGIGVLIVDIQGRSVLKRLQQRGFVISVPVSQLAPGKYVLYAYGNAQVLTAEFVKY